MNQIACTLTEHAENKNRMPCPDNEFSEHCTADMPTMDQAWHEWMQPKYDTQRKEWLNRIKKGACSESGSVHKKGTSGKGEHCMVFPPNDLTGH